MVRVSPALIFHSKCSHTDLQMNSICRGSYKLILTLGEGRGSVPDARTTLLYTILRSGRKSMSQRVLKFCPEEETLYKPCLRHHFLSPI